MSLYPAYALAVARQVRPRDARSHGFYHTQLLFYALVGAVSYIILGIDVASIELWQLIVVLT